MPQFGLPGPSTEERKRRRLVVMISPVFEVPAVGAVFWALTNLPATPLLKTAKENILYFHPVSPDEVKQSPKLLEHSVPPKKMVAAPVTPRLQRKEIQRPAQMAHLEVPEISQPKIELPKTPPEPKPVEHFSSVEVPHPALRQVAMLRVGMFNRGSMARATVRRPARQVHTAGFGADNGISNDPSADSHNRVAQLGSLDLPAGPGYGNGTGGAHGVRGTVVSAGFGSSVGAATGGRPNVTQAVQGGDFGAVVAGKPIKTHSVAEVAVSKPVVIPSKPDRVYPPGARRLHIEGQVTLRVLFGSTGNLRVLKVEQGLGHGMDKAAIDAARRIRSKRAERDGRPVDSTALFHIIFQLAH